MKKTHTIVFQNSHWVLANKAPLVLSVPGRQGENDPRPCLGKMLEEQERCKIYPVHRLDYEVSGLILFAKTSEAHRLGQKWFEEKTIRKIYHALTEGNVQNAPVGRFEDWNNTIVRGKKRSFEAAHGQKSHTHVTCLGANKQNYLCWILAPSTGRPHQLRMQLSMREFPIVGDVLYGSVQPWHEGIALKATELHLDRIPVGERLGLNESFSIDSLDGWPR